MVASLAFRVWESRPVEWEEASASIWGGCPQPAQAVAVEEGMLSHPHPLCSCPGCPASPVEQLGVLPHGTASIAVAVCELPGRCHDMRLDKCAFVGGTHISPACARESVPSPRSALLPAPWFLPYYSHLYHLLYRACVSVSWALPQAFAFQAILPSEAYGLVAYSPYRP